MDGGGEQALAGNSGLMFCRGDGGTQIWFGRGCAAGTLKPLHSFKSHFGSESYPFLGIFLKI